MKKTNSPGVKRCTLSKQVADNLERMIEAGTYSIDSRIPTEPELMELFQVSRNTIREAVQSLMSVGLLEVRQGDGTYVRAVDRFHANMTKKCEQVSLEEISEVRNTLEISIAQLAASRRTKEDIQKILIALENRRCLSSDARENTEADLNFHLAIADACHNAILTAIYRSIADYMAKHILERHLESPVHKEDIDTLHEKLFQAIVAGHPTEATDAAQAILYI